MRRCKGAYYDKGTKVEVEGLFHQWASNYEDCGEAGVGNYTVALVELDDGRVVECLPDTVVFLDRPPSVNPFLVGGAWWRGDEHRTEIKIDCMNCGRSCKRAYPLSTIACPYWISREGLLQAAGTETEEKE